MYASSGPTSDISNSELYIYHSSYSYAWLPRIQAVNIFYYLQYLHLLLTYLLYDMLLVFF